MRTGIRLVYITTAACSAAFLKGQLAYMRMRGFDVLFMAKAGGWSAWKTDQRKQSAPGAAGQR